jgi:Protein of unknown function (DUF3618)
MASDSTQARTPAQIEADIERTRLQMQTTIDAIAERISPTNIARRGAETAKAQVFEPEGSLRTTRVAVLAIGVALVVGLVIWRRGR